MRAHPKTDITQAAIVKALRDAGASVAITSALGKGYPDLTVGWRNDVCILLEVKTGSRPCDRKLTKDEEAFHARWAGPIAVVSEPEEAVNALLRVARRVGAV